MKKSVYIVFCLAIVGCSLCRGFPQRSKRRGSKLWPQVKKRIKQKRLERRFLHKPY